MKPGAEAPDVTAQTSIGETFTLSEVLQDHEVVFYFFPKSFTPL